MFGTLTADRGRMDRAQLLRYTGCYCGLCRTLEKRHGLPGRMTLNYDMTFLILVLGSLYEPEEEQGMGRCPVHPLKKRPYWRSVYTDYGADLNLLLAWWKGLDDWEDEKSLRGWLLHRILSRRCRHLEKAYPRQSAAIRENLTALHRYEAGEEVSADRAADCFGRLMGELFVIREEDHWADTLRRLGHGLGQFIYLSDACVDFDEDARKNRPNPLRALERDPGDREGDRALLEMMLSEAARALEHLPMLRDMDLIRNILYSGVWQSYNRRFFGEEKRGKETPK